MSQTYYEQELQCQFQSQYNIKTCDICSELSYFIIMPFSYKEKYTKKGTVKSIVITYRKDQTTFLQLIQKYKRSNPNEKREQIAFSLSKGYQIPQKNSVKQFKRLVRNQKLDGLVLFTDIRDQKIHNPQVDNENENLSQTSDQCGLMQLIEAQSTLYNPKYQFTFYFLIHHNFCVITVTINPTLNVSTMIDQFLEQMSQQFTYSVTLKDIKSLKIKGSQKILNTKICIKDHKELYDNSQIQVQFKNPNLKLVRNLPNEPYILNIIGLKNQTIKSLNYHEIKNMTLKYVYQRYFEQFYEKQPDQSNKVCLKVMDFVILPNEKLNKIDHAIQKLRQIGNVKLMGHLINQKMIFYSSVNVLADVKPFEISQLKIPQSSSYQRKQCQKKINERLTEMQDQYFQNQKHIEPIMIYTSNLKYEDEQTNQINTIYDALNKFLREQSIISKKIDELKNSWVYRYTSTLLKHLEQLQSNERIVYRGTNYDLQRRQGQTIIFKSFVSTSSKMDVSLRFALKNVYQNPNEHKNLYIMKVKRGRPIAKLSYYGTEQQYLLQPFTQFIITKKQQKKIQYPAQVGQFYDFTVYYMQQIESARSIPKTVNNYILWIDDKQNQGKQIFNKYIKEFLQSTALFQIKSTQQLKKWLKQKEVIIKDVSSNIIMITNMVRIQDEVRNFYAGAQSVLAIREVLPDIPIAVYVRDTDAANNNLKQKNVSYHNLKVISQFQDFAKYVQKYIKVKFIDLTKKFQINNPQLVKKPISEPLVQSQKLQKSNKSTNATISSTATKTSKKKPSSPSKCQIM